MIRFYSSYLLFLGFLSPTKCSEEKAFKLLLVYFKRRANNNKFKNIFKDCIMLFLFAL